MSGALDRPQGLYALAPAAQPMGQQDMLARLLRGNPDPSLPGYPVMKSAEDRGFAPMPRSFADAGQRMAAVLRGDVEPTPGEQMGMNVVRGFTEGPATIRAFHGSPHRFERFDMSRIGTGEGAQAYGHGLYFAGNEGVARSYRDGLAGMPRVSLDGVDLFLDKNVRHDLKSAAVNLALSNGNYSKARSNSSLLAPKFREIELRALDELEQGNAIIKSPGSMYEVNLNTTPDRLLDWDAPLSGQSIEARNIANTVDRVNNDRFINNGPVQTGADIWRNMRNPQVAREFGYKNWSSSGPAEYLRDTGIDGIQYLDAGSRAAGDGTRNYVMFDDKLIDILRRYGIAGTLGGGAAATAGTSE
jgi:hypothetical protein